MSREALELASLFERKGLEELEAARILSGADTAADAVVGFHAQQAVEKFVKAALAARGVEVPRPHDLRFLFELAAANDVVVPADVSNARWLTPWAVEFEELTDPLDRAAAIAAADRVAAWAAALVASAAADNL